MPYTYETDGAAIYRQSFAIIRAEAELARFDAEEEPVAVRMIHACGMVELALSRLRLRVVVVERPRILHAVDHVAT